MGGHGGLNILPQKRWNVYNYDNREKVRRDEEEAARQEQLKREQVQKRDAEFRLEQLRTARGLAPIKAPTADEPKQGHINLFEGIKIFDPMNCGSKKRKGGDDDKKKKEESVGKVVTAEDDKYRLGYGVAGKGVKLPWYLERQRDDLNGVAVTEKKEEKKKKKSGKKSVDELREERLRRERREKERERTLLLENKKRDAASAFITDHINSSCRSTRTRTR